jgi:hypothetical protein
LDDDFGVLNKHNTEPNTSTPPSITGNISLFTLMRTLKFVEIIQNTSTIDMMRLMNAMI